MHSLRCFPLVFVTQFPRARPISQLLSADLTKGTVLTTNLKTLSSVIKANTTVEAGILCVIPLLRIVLVQNNIQLCQWHGKT